MSLLTSVYTMRRSYLTSFLLLLGVTFINLLVLICWTHFSGSTREPYFHLPRPWDPASKTAGGAQEGGVPRRTAAASKEEVVRVFMDFPQSRASWGIAHNRALESILSHYPRAEVVVLVTVPRDHAKLAFADALGTTHFQRYQKRGYNVSVQVINGDSFLDNAGVDPDLPGQDWYRHALRKPALSGASCVGCYNPANAYTSKTSEYQISSATFPLPLLMYIRLAHLWREGGYYTDFNVLWHRPFPPARYFDVSLHACSPVDKEGLQAHVNALQESFNRTGKAPPQEMRMSFPTPPSGAFPSMHMHFVKHDPVLACAMLGLGDPENEKCYAESDDYGRECVIAIMNRCIVQENTFLAEKELCVIQERKSPGQLPASSSSPPRAPCPPSHYSTMRVRQGHIVEWFNCDLRAGMSLPLADDWRQDPRVIRSHALWMGPYVSMGVTPTPTSMFRWDNPFSIPSTHPDSLYARATTDVIALHSWAPAQSCPKLGLEAGVQKAAEGRCTYSEYIEGTRICAPSFFIPGVQKGASTFLFAKLSRHPQVLQSIAGSQYKEVGTYTTRRERYPYRSEFYPYTAPGEPFHVGDASVPYVSSLQAPELILKDNPRAKFLFSLRDPVLRAWSDYRFQKPLYSTKGWTFKEVVRKSIQELQDCCAQIPEIKPEDDPQGKKEEEKKSAKKARQQKKRMSRDLREENQDHCERLDAYAFSRCNQSDPGRIVSRGLYVIFINHYLEHVAADNLHVVTVEEMKENPVMTLGRAAAFLGLCPYDWNREDLDPVHVTGYKGPAKEDGGLDEEIERELRAFYRPFNARLYKVLGRNLGWDKEDRNASMEGTGRR